LGDLQLQSTLQISRIAVSPAVGLVSAGSHLLTDRRMGSGSPYPASLSSSRRVVSSFSAERRSSSASSRFSIRRPRPSVRRSSRRRVMMLLVFGGRGMVSLPSVCPVPVALGHAGTLSRVDAGARYNGASRRTGRHQPRGRGAPSCGRGATCSGPGRGRLAYCWERSRAWAAGRSATSCWHKYRQCCARMFTRRRRWRARS